MARSTGNMAVEMMRENGGVWAGIDVAAAPLRLLHAQYIEKDNLDEEERTACLILERAIEDLDAIGEEAKDSDEGRLKSFARSLERVVRELKPDIEERAVSQLIGDFLIGRKTKDKALHAVG